MKSRIATFVLSICVPILVHAAPPAQEALMQLNGSFRKVYKDARQHMLETLSPVLIAYSSDHLVWLHDGTRVEATYLPEQFATLKTLAHVPLALFALLWRDGAPPLDVATRAEANQLLAQLAQATRDWGSLNLTPEQVTRQQHIVLASQQFVKNVLQSGHFADTTDATAFTKGVRVAVYQNVRDAARGAVDGLHKQVQDWRQEMGEPAWRRLRVVVVGSHMAKKSEMTTQYFLRALQESSEFDRVVFAERPCDDARALESLSVHSLDKEVSRAFFDDPERMHRDILGDAAVDYLNELMF